MNEPLRFKPEQIRLIWLCYVLAALVMFLAVMMATNVEFVDVRGTSMEPTYVSGDSVAIRDMRPRLGDVIVYEHKSGGRVIHRVIDIADGAVLTKGDNNLIDDGWIDERRIAGVVTWHLPVSVRAVWLLSFVFMLVSALVMTVCTIRFSERVLIKLHAAPDLSDEAIADAINEWSSQ